ncbi:MAG: outer membrane biogenesis protein BamB [Candidatus Hydrogenedentes bacterium ADurb.Bin179]|nr:MAG: outer membrane biogenesis protein BamB [Candidatus Hydrogenedentes bacterium ADurb.Bin179]
MITVTVKNGLGTWGKQGVCIFAVFFVVTIVPWIEPAFGDWPDWRGPAADGHSDAEGLPLRWSETENIAWKTALHDFGHSTPVVLDGQVWLTTAKEDGTALYAVCVDLDSGEMVHDIEVFRIEEPQPINALNSYATPSAVIEAGRVYVHYGTFGTACIDTASGDVLWRRSDLNCDHMQGPASSPVLFEDLLIITVEGTDKQFMAALNKSTGATAWLYTRPYEPYKEVKPVFLKSYQTPVLLEIDGKTQLVSNGAMMVTGHALRTGQELWRVLYRDDSTISRIVHGHGLLFVNTGGNPGGTQLWAIREGGAGDVTDSHVAWKLTEDAPHQSSPVLVGDLLYSVSDEGTLLCIKASTGERLWSERLRGKYTSSLLTAAGRIYLSNTRGMTTVIEAGNRYHKLAVNQIDGELWASPAVAENTLLLRTKTHLYRIADTPPQPSPLRRKKQASVSGN